MLPLSPTPRRKTVFEYQAGHKIAASDAVYNRRWKESFIVQRNENVKTIHSEPKNGMRHTSSRRTRRKSQCYLASRPSIPSSRREHSRRAEESSVAHTPRGIPAKRTRGSRTESSTPALRKCSPPMHRLGKNRCQRAAINLTMSDMDQNCSIMTLERHAQCKREASSWCTWDPRSRSETSVSTAPLR